MSDNDRAPQGNALDHTYLAKGLGLTEEQYHEPENQHKIQGILRKGYRRRREILENESFDWIIPTQLDHVLDNDSFETMSAWMLNHFRTVEHMTGTNDEASQFVLSITFTSVGPLGTIKCYVCGEEEWCTGDP